MRASYGHVWLFVYLFIHCSHLLSFHAQMSSPFDRSESAWSIVYFLIQIHVPQNVHMCLIKWFYVCAINTQEGKLTYENKKFALFFLLKILKFQYQIKNNHIKIGYFSMDMDKLSLKKKLEQIKYIPKHILHLILVGSHTRMICIKFSIHRQCHAQKQNIHTHTSTRRFGFFLHFFIILLSIAIQSNICGKWFSLLFNFV